LSPPALFVVPAPLAVDASGVATLQAQNPGGLEGKLAIQALVLDAVAFPRGTSAVASL
jgi:hypothetical protein